MNYSQGDQQEWLDNYFKDHIGVAVDAGANDGVFFSNTLALEERGWRVLCIEPNPEQYSALSQRRAETYQFAVSDYIGTSDFSIVEISRFASDPASSLTPLATKVVARKVPVPVTTLDVLFAENDVTSVDFLNLDIEAGEADALRGLDLDKYRPRLILVEDNHPPWPALPECREILASRYVEIHRILDDVFFERKST